MDSWKLCLAPIGTNYNRLLKLNGNKKLYSFGKLLIYIIFLQKG